MNVDFLSNPHGALRIGDVVLANLLDSRWTSFRAAVAFVKRSGVWHLSQALRDFSRRGSVAITVGVDFGTSSEEGLVQLYDCAGGDGHIWVLHNKNGSTFHPKIYVFRNDHEAFAIVGSGNLTAGGLFTGYEAATAIVLDLANEEDAAFLAQLERALDMWIDTRRGICRELTSDFLNSLM